MFKETMKTAIKEMTKDKDLIKFLLYAEIILVSIVIWRILTIDDSASRIIYSNMNFISKYHSLIIEVFAGGMIFTVFKWVIIHWKEIGYSQENEEQEG